MPVSTGSSKTISAVSSPTGGRDAAAFSTLMASAGRLGTVPPGGGEPVSGQVGAGGGGVWLGVGVGLGDAVGDTASFLRAAAFLWVQPGITITIGMARQGERRTSSITPPPWSLLPSHPSPAP